MLNNSNQSSFGINGNVMTSEKISQPTAPAIVLVPNQLLTSNQFQQIQYGNTPVFVPNFGVGNPTPNQIQQSNPPQPQLVVPQTQQQFIQAQTYMQQAYLQQQQMYTQQMQMMYAQAQAGQMPMQTTLVMHNGQLVHYPVMPNGLGVTYAHIQQQNNSRALQAIHPNNSAMGSGKIPEPTKATSPEKPFSPSKAPAKRKSAAKADTASPSPAPTFTPQRTPSEKGRTPRRKPFPERPTSTPRPPMTSRGSEHKRYVPPGRRLENTPRKKPTSERVVREYSVDFLINIRKQYLSQNPPKGLFSAPSLLLTSNKFDFALFESLATSDESWRAKVMELKQSNPLMTKVRNALNKVTATKLKIFTKELAEILKEASSQGNDVLTAAMETFMSVLFKKAAVEKVLHPTYADLLLKLNEKFWEGNQDTICNLMHAQIEVECRSLFNDLNPDKRFAIRGSSAWLAVLLDRGAVGDTVFFDVIQPVVDSLEDEDETDSQVRNLALDVSVQSLLCNLKLIKAKAKRGKTNPKLIRERFGYYAQTLENLQDTFKPRERFAIQDFLDDYYAITE